MPPSYRFVRDVTMPDDAEVAAGASFTKTWRIENDGDVPWTADFAFSHVEGRAMTPNTHRSLPPCEPGEEVEISVNLTAPEQTGAIFSDWRLRDASGEFFGEPLWTRITVVPAPAEQPEESATNDAIYIADVTIEDDAEIAPGTSFTKTWRIKNTGTRDWGPGYALSFQKGTPMTDHLRVPLPGCAAGDECEVSIRLTAPQEPGSYFGDWELQDPEGNVFGVLLWFRIVVPGEDRAAEPPRPEPTIEVNTPAPHYSQRDRRWRSVVLGHQGSPVTIGSWGCLLTCFAMKACALGYQVTPVELNRRMIRQGGFWQGHFTKWDALAVVFDDLIFEGKEEQHPRIVTRIDTHLADQIPVPVLVDRTPQTRYNDNDQHWVLVVARNATTDYWVFDPIDLDRQPVSLMQRYGRDNDSVRGAVRSAIFYRREA